MLNKRLQKIGWSQRGQSVAEYAIVLSLIAMFAILVLRGIGVSTNNSMTPVNNVINQ